MKEREISRRAVLHGSAALAGLVALGVSRDALAALEAAAEEQVIPWLDQPPPPAFPPEEGGQQLVWEELGGFLTPTAKFFYVQHYGPRVIPAPGWRLAVGGLVRRPIALSLAELRKRPRKELTFTLECSGNHGFPDFTGAVGTATWAGTPLAPLLREAGPLPEAREVVFWGADAGEGKVGEQTVVEQ